MTLDQLIAHYGLFAIFLGAGLEGEAAVMTGGALAATGLIHPVAAAGAAFAGSFLADQLFFQLGRRAQDNRFVARIRARSAFARALGWIERRPTGFVLAFRFLYGLRIAGPIAIGIAGVPVRRFVLLNAISAAVWAGLFTFVGWRFGRELGPLLARLRHHLHGPILLIPAAFVMAALIAIVLRRRRHRQA